jgi:hypothetical protein
VEKRTKMFRWVALALIISNCIDDQEIQPIDNFGARLVAYDEDDTERTAFKANTDIGFILCIFNTSAKDIDVGARFDYCNAYRDEEFLHIYKIIGDGNGNEQWMPYGRPYRPPVYCPTINLPIIVPAGGEAKVVGGRWNNDPDNPPFTPGKYYTAFSFNSEVAGQSRKHELKLEFEVY